MLKIFPIGLRSGHPGIWNRKAFPMEKMREVPRVSAAQYELFRQAVTSSKGLQDRASEEKASSKGICWIWVKRKRLTRFPGWTNHPYWTRWRLRPGQDPSDKRTKWLTYSCWGDALLKNFSHKSSEWCIQPRLRDHMWLDQNQRYYNNVSITSDMQTGCHDLQSLSRRWLKKLPHLKSPRRCQRSRHNRPGLLCLTVWGLQVNPPFRGPSHKTRSPFVQSLSKGAIERVLNETSLGFYS